jgi:hypothetical protein
MCLNLYLKPIIGHPLINTQQEGLEALLNIGGTFAPPKTEFISKTNNRTPTN